MLTRFVKEVEISDPFGPSVADRIAFKSNLNFRLSQRPTSVSFELDHDACDSWRPSTEILAQAKLLLGRRGFPQLSRQWPTIDDRWFALSKGEQYALLLVAAAMAASDQLKQLIEDGRVCYETVESRVHHVTASRSPRTLEVKLSWTEAEASWLAERIEI